MFRNHLLGPVLAATQLLGCSSHTPDSTFSSPPNSPSSSASVVSTAAISPSPPAYQKPHPEGLEEVSMTWLSAAGSTVFHEVGKYPNNNTLYHPHPAFSDRFDDFNGDGKVDLILRGKTYIMVMPNSAVLADMNHYIRY